MDYVINVNQLETNSDVLSFRIEAAIGNNQIDYLDYTDLTARTKAIIQAFDVNKNYQSQGYWLCSNR